MTNHSLFSTPEAQSLEERLMHCFEEWLADRQSGSGRARSHRPLSDKSAAVYRDMWRAFAVFCADRSLGLHQVEAADLAALLRLRAAMASGDSANRATAHRQLNLRYARRFLTLIQWVSGFQDDAVGGRANQAARTMLEQPQYKYANASDKDPLPDFLTDEQADRLIAFITQPVADDADDASMKWNAMRNRTAAALMMGGGLTPGDVRNLLLDGVATQAGIPWKLSLPGNGNFPARETPLAPWAGRQLAAWLTVRKEHGIAGDFALPGRRSGSQWSEVGCYETTRDVLEQAGLGDLKGGVFKLRHTFALRQLANGREEKDVARWLGLLDINGMARYRRVLHAPVEVV
ncbi:tyrosine-type recombinase/integrase [Noviherbaspirillum denitrificans]|uniref:Tyr recombinase domain-containing protein n=1 Tax=Noviherbaspirillum denitrificans TaxID=1968433 RepID=A0A254T6C5_9BURK|nr:tyrosine-type recombinase/integrase [Noviherbaspirillum denitrificans]OWW18229.1 hypothetical protein AYR66_02385 [Noviherbaspirillum denitrificans]